MYTLPRPLDIATGFVVSAALSLLGLTAVTFAIGRFIPVDPVLAIVGDHAKSWTLIAETSSSDPCCRNVGLACTFFAPRPALTSIA